MSGKYWSRNYRYWPNRDYHYWPQVSFYWPEQALIPDSYGSLQIGDRLRNGIAMTDQQAGHARLQDKLRSGITIASARKLGAS